MKFVADDIFVTLHLKSLRLFLQQIIQVNSMGLKNAYVRQQTYHHCFRW